MEDPNQFNVLIVEDLKEQVKRLEARLVGIESHARTEFPREAAGGVAHEESVGDHDQQTNSINFIPEVRKCNFVQFKNFFAEKEGCYAIDVLESGVLLAQEIQTEQTLRDRLGEGSGKAPSKAAKRKTDALVKDANQTMQAFRNAQRDQLWIRRIRLQSPALLKIFSKIQGETWSSRPRVYCRPFCPFIYYLPQLQAELKELDERWGGHLGSNSTETPGKGTESISEELDEGEDSLDDSPEALAVLRCFVNFLEAEIVPDSTRFENLNYSSDAKIRFSDLCYLFKIGDILYRPVEGEVPGYRDYRMGQRSWRVYHTSHCSGRNTETGSEHPDNSQNGQEINEGGFHIQSYGIEHTGDELCVIANSFTIPPYDGLKPINSLPAFPLRFYVDHESFLPWAVELGDQVLQAIETKHATYNGWTVIRTTKGGFVTDSNGVILKHPEHINSEVMVDFGEAFQACPSWRPVRASLRPETLDQIMVDEGIKMRWWSGPDRAILLREVSAITPHRTGIHTFQRNKFIAEDPFIVEDVENQRTGRRTTSKNLRPEDKVLIACRVFAYVLRERKFAQLDVRRLKPSAQSWVALDSLKIPKETKDLIKGSVRGHLMQKEAEKRNSAEEWSLDVIQGKGTGLFILLHGVPGVGKTATAEAIAQANGKPLFKISVGDLGLTPEQVESSLMHIFRLASNWDCILLMDEVDTFFAQRSKGDAAIIKNALVSVFLRILDYYTGILFMTTNRAGVLDEAFNSRIHYKLYYPPLNKQQTLDIWHLNIQRLRHLEEKCNERQPLQISESAILEFAEDHFNRSFKSTGQWNGRQIRNAFQVARSLALFDFATETARSTGPSTNGPRPAAVLDVKHFHLMDKITESFELYMKEVFSGSSRADLALEMEHRADHWTTKIGISDARGERNYSSIDGRSPFESSISRPLNGRPRSSSNTLGRPHNSITASTQRYGSSSLQPHFGAGYDESAMDDPRMDANLKSPRSDSRRQSSPRNASGFDFRSLGRGNAGYSMESRRQSTFVAEADYCKDRNDYGKRERD